MAEARGVEQQVFDGDGTYGRAGRTAGRVDDLHDGELWQVLVHRVVEPELAVVVQHHHGYGGDRLGHRVDAEERPFGHRRAGGEILHAGRLQIADAAVPGHGRHGPGDLAGGDQLREQRRGLVEHGWREADRVWRHARQRRRGLLPGAHASESQQGQGAGCESQDHRCILILAAPAPVFRPTSPLSVPRRRREWPRRTYRPCAGSQPRSGAGRQSRCRG